MTSCSKKILWTLSVLLASLHTAPCSQDNCSCSVYEDPVYLSGRDTEFDAQYCLQCLECANAYYAEKLSQVDWKYGEASGVATKNQEEMTYHVMLDTPLGSPGLYEFSITYKYVCFNAIDDRRTATKEKSLDVFVYGANVTHYRRKEDGSVNFECRTGLHDVGKEDVRLTVDFSGDDSHKCSAVCGEEQELPCDWSNLKWTEESGLCRLTIARPNTSDSGELCCSVSHTKSSTYTACDHLSVVEAEKISQSTQHAADHESKQLYVIIGGSVGGLVTLIIVVLIVVAVVVRTWRRRRRNYDIQWAHRLVCNGEEQRG